MFYGIFALNTENDLDFTDLFIENPNEFIR